MAPALSVGASLDFSPKEIKVRTPRRGHTKNIVVNKPRSTVAELAKNVGMMFFNILRLNCIEPVYPKICVESTIYYQISRLLGWNNNKRTKTNDRRNI